MWQIEKRVIPAVLAFLLIACANIGHAGIGKAVPFDPQPDRARNLVIADTLSGQVAGFRSNEGLSVFLGIPYAEPPKGDLRFAPPKPVQKWSYVKPAYLLAPTCLQVPDKTEPVSFLYQDEDCLALNVWTPGVDAKKRPVLVYIHGGGFIGGGSGDGVYNGEHLAKRGDIVVVSINYRVGAPGFLYLEDNGPEFSGSVNMGLQDQVVALKWIKNNIARFGGDPKNITIMGESAGSMSVMFHMISPKSKGLFNKAIAQSGAITKSLLRSKAQAKEHTRQFMELAGVKDANELRALPATRMVELQAVVLEKGGVLGDVLFAPVIDDVMITSDPVKAFADGAAAGIPFLNGTTLDEFRYWGVNFPSLMTTPAKKALANLPVVKGPSFDKLYNYYDKLIPRSDISGITFAMMGDYAFRMPHIRVSDLQSKHAPVWMYRFDWKSRKSPNIGACHAIELPFLFRTFDSSFSKLIIGPAPSMNLSDTMMDAWIAFVRTGDPNGPGSPSWPAYETQKRSTMIFNEESAVKDDPERDTRILYEEIVY